MASNNNNASQSKIPSTNSHALVVRSSLGPFPVKSPPIKKHMIAGHLVPTMRSRFLLSKKRLVVLEIHCPEGEEGVVVTENLDNKLETLELKDQDQVCFRVFREAKHGDDDSDDEDDESACTSNSVDEELELNGKSWKEHKKYRSDNIQVLKVSSKTLEIKLGAGNETVVRDFKFESSTAAQSLQKAIAKCKELEMDRAKRQAEAFVSKMSLTKEPSQEQLGPGHAKLPDTAAAVVNAAGNNEKVNLLVEIVSATDLPITDMTSTDAYCIVRMKGQELHRTKVISNNLNPIWTMETGGIFLIRSTPEEFFSASSGMTFTLKDHDTLGSNDMIGTVNLSLESIMESTGERTSHDILLDKKVKPPKNGAIPKLHLRIRPASKSDIEFMELYANSKTKYGVYANETFLAVRKQETKFLRRQTKKIDGVTVHRVRPCPDPDRPETKWLSDAEIETEALKPSTEWVEAGSGNLGKLYVEVIGCDGLPNMDTGIGDKTDAFCCAVFEDCVVNTDVIGDALSPRWMPWCHRAFCFNIANPSSHLFLGVYDHDNEISPTQIVASDVHDPIARLVVNVSQFRPDTTYFLKYDLYFGETAEHRTKTRGTITLRIRTKFPDIRAAMMAAMSPPVSDVVAVQRKVDYAVAHYATDGAVNELNFSLPMISSYAEELLGYLVILESISAAVMTVWLWRGHFRIEIGGETKMLPLHSITAFVWGVLVTWNYDLLPSFWLFSIGWILLACNGQARQHPSRWCKCPSYEAMVKRFIYGKATPETIGKQDQAAITTYENALAERVKRRLEEKRLEAEQEERLQAQLGAELAEAENAEKIEGKNSGIVSHPLKPVLHPIQLQLRQLVISLRIVKSIVMWKEPYYSFWIVTGCFAVSFVFFWVPWAFLLRWTLRIVVFAALGPWMMLVDKHYFKTDPNLSVEEQEKQLRERLSARAEEVLKSASDFFIRKEDAIKSKSMKKCMFGRYLLRVPQFLEDLYFDQPRAESTATPYLASSELEVDMDERKYGQNLVGSMIPQREVQMQSPGATKPALKKGVSLKFWKKKDVKPSSTSSEAVPLLAKEPKSYDSVAAEKKND